MSLPRTEESRPINRQRFPTLNEVLRRETAPPVHLFSFYIYMRDQQRSVDYLDFWLDISQHMSLCRHYVRELRRSVLVDTPDLEKAGSKRNSAMLDNMIDLGGPAAGPSARLDEKGHDQRLSAFLRSDNESKNSAHNSNGHNSNGSNGSSRQSSSHSRSQDRLERPRPSFMNSGTTSGQDSGSPGQLTESPAHTVTRADLRASAEKILYTYLLPGSEREIVLPQAIVNDITEAIEEQGRDDPELFDVAKDYVYQAMERDAFPGFLRSKALGNLVPPSMMARLILGLVAMFAGFWAAFIFIFLNYSHALRCWVILPFTIGVYALVSHQYILDPLLALAGVSEYTFLNFSRVKEPFVRSQLGKRALVALGWIVLFDAALVCLFVFVPGKRL